MFNSDGYILLDFTGVDITKTNQYLKGIYQRVINSIDTNKLALVINAGNLTPQAAIIHKRLNFYVITTSLYIFTVNSNDIIIIEQAGQSQVDVSIVPTLTEGVKVADFTIGAVEGSIYAPEFQTEINDNVTASNTTWSSNKISDDLALKANTSSLASVATTGDYDDLIDKPSIPTKTSDLVNDSGFITSAQVPTIDDNAVASDKVWSSYKTSAELGNKANSTDVYTKTEVDNEISKLIPNITTIATISDTVINSTDKDIYTINLNKGIYIFNGSTLWKTSGTAQGLTMIALLGNNTVTQNLEYTVGWCVENVTAIFQVLNDNTEFKIRLYQTTGANIAVDFSGNITRINE